MVRTTLLLLIYLICQNLFAETTVATFNIANYNNHGDWSERVKLIARAISNTHADVILLQEVRFDPDEPSSQLSYQNMAEQILNLLHQNDEFHNAMLVTQPAMYYPDDIAFPSPGSQTKEHHSYLWEGLSIISKRKILETGSIYLTHNCSDINKRITQYIKVEDQGHPLYLFNIHFAYMPDCMQSNASETINYIKRVAHGAPLIIMGDFNITADDPAFRYFTEAHLIDAWQALHPDDAGYTFPAGAPQKRIDFVWVNKMIADKLKSPQQLLLFADNKVGNLFPSDHYGLVLRY